MKKDKYTYRVTWSEKDKEYIGLCSEFPSLSWLAKTQDDALKGIRLVVKSVILDMQDSGEVIPDPISCKSYSGKFMVRVLPETHRDLAMEAADSGVSLNRLANAKLSQ
jgi:predicted HicB family RNase H-like nuclease